MQIKVKSCRKYDVILAYVKYFPYLCTRKGYGMVINDPKIENPVLHLIGETADRMGLECYVIGGWVRDLFLHRPSTDIDVVVVGSGIALAEEVAKRLGKGAHLSVFKTYGTAQVKWRKPTPTLPKGKELIELEFVGARKESYHQCDGDMLE